MHETESFVLTHVYTAFMFFIIDVQNSIELGLLSHRHISGHLGTHKIEDFVSRSHLQ